MMGYLAPAPAPTPVPSAPRTPRSSSMQPPVNTALGSVPGGGAPRPTPAAQPAVAPPGPTTGPTAALPDVARQVSLPAPPQPDRGLPWALPVALIAIAVVTLAIVATILLT